MANPFYFVVSDEDKKNWPIDDNDLEARITEIFALIPQPPKREHDNNMRYVEKAFTLFKDCGLITEKYMEYLNDKAWCDSHINGYDQPHCERMNPLGGVLRREGLKMWDTGLRYYCPYEELTQTSDKMIADTKKYPGASKLAVICEGVTYYVSNDWYSDDQTYPTKSAFALWLFLVTNRACQEHWAEQKIVEAPTTDEYDNLTTPETTSKPDDLQAVLASLKELHKKFDEMNEKITFLYDELK